MAWMAASEALATEEAGLPFQGSRQLPARHRGGMPGWTAAPGGYFARWVPRWVPHVGSHTLGPVRYQTSKRHACQPARDPPQCCLAGGRLQRPAASGSWVPAPSNPARCNASRVARRSEQSVKWCRSAELAHLGCRTKMKR